MSKSNQSRLHTSKLRSSLVRSAGISAAIASSLMLSQAAWSTDQNQPRIVGGKDAASGQYPWQVAIVSNLNDAYQTQYCGGTLIDASWVLTAAHCIKGTPSSEEIYIAVGFTNLTNISQAETSRVKKRVVHKIYNSSTLNNDIALLELETPVDLARCGSRCEVVDVVTPEDATSFEPSARAWVSGWGSTSSTSTPSYPSKLQWAEVTMMDCVGNPSLYNAADITDNMICAATPSSGWDKDSCQGDSGGPLVVADSSGTGSYKLAGVVSWGEGCASNGYPGVYTKVANYTKWIEKRGGAIDGIAALALLTFGAIRIRRKRSA